MTKTELATELRTEEFFQASIANDFPCWSKRRVRRAFRTYRKLVVRWSDDRLIRSFLPQTQANKLNDAQIEHLVKQCENGAAFEQLGRKMAVYKEN
jgi:hypothetical protein